MLEISQDFSIARDLAREYDARRRLEAALFIDVMFGLLLTLFIAGLTVYIVNSASSRTNLPLAFVLDGVLAACLALFVLSGFAARRALLPLAVGSAVLATNLAVLSFEVLWVFSLDNGLDHVILIMFGASGVAIGLAGALGEPWMVVGTMAIMNIFTIAIIADTSIKHGSDFHSILVNDGLFTLLALIEQWAFAAIALTLARLNRKTLQDIGGAYAQVRQVDTLKDQFITHVNHELRTPVMTVQGYVEYLRFARDTMSVEKQATTLEKVSRAVEGLATLLSSILDVRAIDQDDGSFIPQVVVIQEALDAALLLIDPREGVLGERELRVDIPAGLSVLGDPTRLQQIVINLVSNAIKYSPDGTPIEICARPVTEMVSFGAFRLRAARTERQMVEITVRDYGLGIPQDQIPLLFNRFVRLPRDLASSVVGNGLGLYLCQVMTQIMGGRIWIESIGKPGEGTAVILRLPLANPANAPGEGTAVI